MKRDNAIDLVRGTAIVTMVWANLAPFAMIDPHPLWFRFIGSFAAPLFVLLAGMMIPMTATERSHPLSYYIQRGTLVVVLAMLIDVLVWRHWPFFSFDILYLIGIGIPVVFLSLRLAILPRAMVAFGVLAASAGLRANIGYPAFVRQPRISAATDYVHTSLGILDDNILTGGFFPLFPWLGVMILGSTLGTWRWRGPRIRRFDGPKAIAGAFSLLALGIAGWRLDPGSMFVRGGCSEIFYPPTTGYLMLALGVCACSLVACEYLQDFRFLAPVCRLGRSSLFLYWWHTALIAVAVRPWIEPQTLPFFVAAYAVMMVVLYGSVLAREVHRTRQTRTSPFDHLESNQRKRHDFEGREYRAEGDEKKDRERRLNSSNRFA